MLPGHTASQVVCVQAAQFGAVNLGGPGGLTLRSEGAQRMRVELAGRQTGQLEMQPLISALNTLFEHIYPAAGDAPVTTARTNAFRDPVQCPCSMSLSKCIHSSCLMS